MSKTLVDFDLRQNLRFRDHWVEVIRSAITVLSPEDVLQFHAKVHPSYWLDELFDSTYRHVAFQDGPDHYIVQYYRSVAANAVFHVDCRKIQERMAVRQVFHLIHHTFKFDSGPPQFEVWCADVPFSMLEELEKQNVSFLTDASSGKQFIITIPPQKSRVLPWVGAK